MVRGDPPDVSYGFPQKLARSSVMRFSQTQNFFRSKKLVLFAKILFGGFPRGILKDPRGFVPTPCPKSWYSISAFSTLHEAILLLLDFFESAWIVLALQEGAGRSSGKISRFFLPTRFGRSKVIRIIRTHFSLKVYVWNFIRNQKLSKSVKIWVLWSFLLMGTLVPKRQN